MRSSNVGWLVRIIYYGVFSHKWDISITTPLWSSGTISEEQIAGLLKPETGADQSGGPGKPVSSEHDSTATLLNTKQLWLPAQDQYEIKPIFILVWSEFRFLYSCEILTYY